MNHIFNFSCFSSTKETFLDNLCRSECSFFPQKIVYIKLFLINKIAFFFKNLCFLSNFCLKVEVSSS